MVMTIARFCTLKSGNKVDWELRILIVTQLGHLLEAAGFPSGMKRHLSYVYMTKEEVLPVLFSLQVQVKNDKTK